MIYNKYKEVFGKKLLVKQLQMRAKVPQDLTRQQIICTKSSHDRLIIGMLTTDLGETSSNNLSDGLVRLI